MSSRLVPRPAAAGPRRVSRVCGVARIPDVKNVQRIMKFSNSVARGGAYVRRDGRARGARRATGALTALSRLRLDATEYPVSIF